MSAYTTLLSLCTLFFCMEFASLNIAILPDYAQQCFDLVDPKYHNLAVEVFTCHKRYPNKIDHALHCAQLLNNHTQLVSAATCFVYNNEGNKSIINSKWRVGAKRVEGTPCSFRRVGHRKER